jgi:hypothetical protein
MASKLDWRDVVAQVIYRAYPDSDLLPIDPPIAGETIGDFAVRAEGAGDTLFLFLCREANDDIDAEEYLHRLDRALRDIEQVHDAFADLVADAAPRLPSSPSSIP